MGLALNSLMSLVHHKEAQNNCANVVQWKLYRREPQCNEGHNIIQFNRIPNSHSTFPSVILYHSQWLSFQGGIQPCLHLTVEAIHVDQCDDAVRHADVRSCKISTTLTSYHWMQYRQSQSALASRSYIFTGETVNNAVIFKALTWHSPERYEVWKKSVQRNINEIRWSTVTQFLLTPKAAVI
jgi:hypothetical protein